MARSTRRREGRLILISSLVAPLLFSMGPALFLEPREDARHLEGVELIAGPVARADLGRSAREAGKRVFSLQRASVATPLIHLPSKVPPSVASFRFDLRDARTGQLLCGSVRIINPPATLAARGWHPELRLEPSPRVVARFAAAGYHPRQIHMAVTTGARQRMEVQLEPLTGIRGIVTAEGSAVPSLTIGIVPLGAPLQAYRTLPRTITDGEGCFYLPHREKGRYRLVATCAARQLIQGPVVTLDASQTAATQWQLPWQVRDLRLVDSLDQPHRGARLAISQDSGASVLLASAHTDSQGIARLLQRAGIAASPLVEATLASGSHHRLLLDWQAPTWTWRIP